VRTGIQYCSAPWAHICGEKVNAKMLLRHLAIWEECRAGDSGAHLHYLEIPWDGSRKELPSDD